MNIKVKWNTLVTAIAHNAMNPSQCTVITCRKICKFAKLRQRKVLYLLYSEQNSRFCLQTFHSFILQSFTLCLGTEFPKKLSYSFSRVAWWNYSWSCLWWQLIPEVVGRTFFFFGQSRQPIIAWKYWLALVRSSRAGVWPIHYELPCTERYMKMIMQQA